MATKRPTRVTSTVTRYITGDEFDSSTLDRLNSAVRRASGTGPTKKQRATLRSDQLPIVSTLAQSDMESAIGLMQADRQYAAEIKEKLETRRLIKEALADIAARNSIPGFRWGGLATHYKGMVTRKKLSRTKLVENNVTVAQIQASYVDSKPFLDVRVYDVNMPDEEIEEWGEDEDE